MTDQLLCGAARRCITPPEGLLPRLRALRDREFGGVLDDLYVRVIALQNGNDRALLVAADLDKVPYPAELSADLRKETGISENSIFCFSVHTHSAPVTGDRPEEPPNNMRNKAPEVQMATAEYEALVRLALLEAAREAVAALRPATMGLGEGESYINVNRTQDYIVTRTDGVTKQYCALGVDPVRPVDRRLSVLRFTGMDGSPIAFFINYPVHNCVMISNQCCGGKMGVSADIGGNACRPLEENFPGSVALWSSGAAGDVNPLMSNEMYYPNPETGEMVETVVPGGDTTMLTVLAARHHADILSVLCGMDTPAKEMESMPIRALVDWCHTPGRNVTRLPNGDREIRTGDGVDPYEIRIQMLRLGSVVLCGFSGELYSALGEQIKPLFGNDTPLLVNHNGSLMARSGYIFDDETFAHDSEERLPGHRGSHILPGYVADALTKKTREMLARL